MKVPRLNRCVVEIEREGFSDGPTALGENDLARKKRSGRSLLKTVLLVLTVVAAVVTLACSTGSYLYWQHLKTTPQYSLALIVDAAKRDDQAGVSTLVFSFVVGLGDYAFALAFVVGLFSLIPVVGAFISGAIMTLLGLTVSPTVALVALIYYLAYQQFESYVIYPRIMKRSVDLPGSVTVVAALVGGSLMGIVGALLAVPVAAALLLLHREVLLTRQDAR